VRCQKLQQVSEVQSFGLGTRPKSFCHSFINCPLDIMLFKVSPEIYCSGVSRRYYATIVIETMQLVLRQFKNFLSYQLRIE